MTKSRLSIEERIRDLTENYPVEKVIIFVYSAGKCFWQGTNEKLIPYEYKKLTQVKLIDTEGFNKDLDNYYTELRKLYKEAYDNFAEFMGWENVDPNIVNWIKCKCYDDHRSGGFQEVMNRANDYEELITIIKDLK